MDIWHIWILFFERQTLLLFRKAVYYKPTFTLLGRNWCWTWGTLVSLVVTSTNTLFSMFLGFCSSITGILWVREEAAASMHILISWKTFLICIWWNKNSFMCIDLVVRNGNSICWLLFFRQYLNMRLWDYVTLSVPSGEEYVCLSMSHHCF